MASCTMYKMKPFYSDEKVAYEQRSSMYKMKNIHDDCIEDLNTVDEEVVELLKRQKAVLAELDKLKLEVEQISEDIGLNTKFMRLETKFDTKASSATKETMTKMKNVPCNIVIKSSPYEPPLSAILMYFLVRHHGQNCSLLSHVHSSWSNLFPKKLNDVLKKASCTEDSSLCWRFIWKGDLLAPSIMATISDQSPILGEANILRYLARRFLPHLYEPGQPLILAAIDDWLNCAAGPKKALLEQLNKYLAKNKWLVGNNFSLADIYCSVATVKCYDDGMTVPKNVAKWLSECSEIIPGFCSIKNIWDLVN